MICFRRPIICDISNGKRHRWLCRMFSWAMLLVVMPGVSSLWAQQPADPITAVEQTVKKQIKDAKRFPEVPRDCDWSQHLKLLARLQEQRLQEHIAIDPDRVKQHFQGIGDKRLAQILDRWGLKQIDDEQYLSVPFFLSPIAPENGQPGGSQFIVSDKLLVTDKSCPHSTRVFYRNFFLVHAALPEQLRTAPRAWTYGLSAFLAQELVNATSITSCPDMEVEATIAALLVKKNPRLIEETFPENTSRFDSGAYWREVQRTIAAINGKDGKAAVEELMRSPEDYNAELQCVQQQREAKTKEDRPYLPYVHPSMRMLWMILPDEEDGIRKIVDDVAPKIHNSTLRLVLINACYDKLCAMIGIKKAGMLCDSSILLRNAAAGELEKLNVPQEPLLNEFAERQKEVLKVFAEDLDHRNQARLRLPDMAYDPTMLKWTFRFLYNYSFDVRRKEHEFRKTLQKANPKVSGKELDKLVSDKITADQIRDAWLADANIAKLCQVAGTPALKLEPNPTTETGKVLECRWSLTRQVTTDLEDVRVRIVDSFSSGGGEPKPGVWTEAKVVVRKALDAAPTVVKLGEVEKGFYVQSINRLDVEKREDSRKEQEPQDQDWARVVKLERHSTRAPWQVESGGSQPLATGRIQKVRGQLQKSDEWKWHEPLVLQSQRDRLFAIRPEGVIPDGKQAEFGLAEVTNSGPWSQDQDLVVLHLSHREVEELKETGEAVWGYFAESRLVQAPVFPAPDGIDGKAFVEVPKGSKMLQAITAAEGDDAGDSIHGFDYDSPNTFVDGVKEVESAQVDYYVDMTYQLPGGGKASIRLAEGQKVLAWDAAHGKLQLKKVYQLELGAKLVSEFAGPRGAPKCATLTAIAGNEQPLGVYRLKLDRCPLIRANGLLLPVMREKTLVAPGIELNSLIQLAPPMEAIREATETKIDLSGAEVRRAGGVKAGDMVLSYNTTLPPKSYWKAQLCDVKDYECERYVRIVTPHATLDCGHWQKVYATESDWVELKEIQASDLKPGKHRVVYLAPGGKPVQWKDVKDAESHLRQVAENAFSRVETGAAVKRVVAAGTAELVPVVAVQEMYASTETAGVALREFKAADTRIARLGLRPTMFANGIMVKLRFEFSGTGEDPGGGQGPYDGDPKSPEERGPGKYSETYTGVIRDIPPEVARLAFNKEDEAAFKRNRADLVKAFDSSRPSPDAVRPQILNRFLRQYYSPVPPPDDLYKRESLQRLLDGYLQARDYLTSMGDIRVLPAVTNGYFLLATLLYEAEAKEAGDALTRDYLCLIVRCVKEPLGKELYAGSQRVRFPVRDGLLAIRELLLYVRQKSAKSGTTPVMRVRFPAASFDVVLKSAFIAKEGCSPDIYPESDVNLYNLCRQLDEWSKAKSRLIEPIIAPGFQPNRLFESDEFRRRLGTYSE